VSGARRSVLALLALLGLLSTGSLGAVEFALDEAAYYPEGPTVVNGALYWAEMPAHRIRRHENGNTITMWTKPGCGPTSIKPDGRGGFWILCHLAHRVLRVNERFEEVLELADDGAGHKLVYPNDATSDERGQLYFSSSGRFDLAAPAEGAIFFIDLNDKVTRLVSGLRYANGVHLDRKRSRLFIGEHLARRVHVAQVLHPGKIGPLKLFFDLNASPALRHHDYPLAGPDGMLVRPDGRLLVAEYGAGRVLVLSAAGKLEKVIPVPMQFVTNFGDWGEHGVVVVGAFQNDVMPMPGRVITLPQ
jgi:sugar lactone lactonase YvrE